MAEALTKYLGLQILKLKVKSKKTRQVYNGPRGVKSIEAILLIYQ